MSSDTKSIGVPSPKHEGSQEEHSVPGTDASPKSSTPSPKALNLNEFLDNMSREERQEYIEWYNDQMKPLGLGEPQLDQESEDFFDRLSPEQQREYVRALTEDVDSSETSDLESGSEVEESSSPVRAWGDFLPEMSTREQEEYLQRVFEAGARDATERNDTQRNAEIPDLDRRREAVYLTDDDLDRSQACDDDVWMIGHIARLRMQLAFERGRLQGYRDELASERGHFDGYRSAIEQRERERQQRDESRRQQLEVVRREVDRLYREEYPTDQQHDLVPFDFGSLVPEASSNQRTLQDLVPGTPWWPSDSWTEHFGEPREEFTQAQPCQEPFCSCQLPNEQASWGDDSDVSSMTLLAGGSNDPGASTNRKTTAKKEPESKTQDLAGDHEVLKSD